MKLDVKTLAVVLALAWGGAMFVTGMASLIWPGYGQALLEVMASVYPGYAATPSFGQVLVGTLYGILDGALAGAVLAWLYKFCASRLIT